MASSDNHVLKIYKENLKLENINYSCAKSPLCWKPKNVFIQGYKCELIRK